ncbi:hypothetical protein F2Q69_00040219 [Brassica cretica]|uniref:Uncharacterized protein n=1 Tax=Brassica cretica TaxID=69181 RepID=A0A8S9NV76_BRACR|nr:hypothetical protein F2Q69_00040219 [Brassica cretica]
MDSTPYAEAANFVELLNSQQDSVFRLIEASESVNAHVDVDDDGTNLHPGVKAAKARGKKKPMVEGKEVPDFQTMWELKKEDLVRKERVVKLRLIGVTCSIGVTRHCHGLSCFTSCSVTECCSVLYSCFVVSRSVLVHMSLFHLFTCLL